MRNSGLLKYLPRTNKTGWPWSVEVNPNIYNNDVDWPKISIITPSYNQDIFIEETIRSILLQNYPNLDYIIIDGGSDDSTIDIIKKYSEWITFWISEKDNGQSHAINKGIDFCKGSIFNWLNSDDYLEEKAFFYVTNEFRNSELDIVSGKEYIFSDSKRRELRNGSLLYPNLEETIFHSVIYQPSTFWRLDIVNEIYPLDESLHYLMDSDLWIRYLLKYGQTKIKKINFPLVNFRLHKNSKSVSKKIKFLRERWFLRRTLLENLNIRDSFLLDACNYLSDGKSLIVTQNWRVEMELNQEYLTNFYYNTLLTHFYSIKDYAWASRTLKEFKTRKKFNIYIYEFKINFLPRKILNWFRSI